MVFMIVLQCHYMHRDAYLDVGCFNRHNSITPDPIPINYYNFG